MSRYTTLAIPVLFDIQATLPEGIVIVSDSHEGTQDGQVLTWQLTQAPQSEVQTIILNLSTTNMIMSEELLFEVSHTVNENQQSETLEPVYLEGIPVALINGESEVELTANEQTTLSLSGASSTVPNSDDVATYIWTQVSGPSLSIEDNSLAEIDLILPDVISDDVAVLELTISNGKVSCQFFGRSVAGFFITSQ
ncbi:hypothetical protein [Shewanella benthica]|uniref:hypothetical protein n=1 Tax=Shewanella benthica TaxID=43661 RepID=UPI0018E086A7|nr:hypothetical protein [Shewanella benthica]